MLLPYMETGRIEAGCDEAGRGCLAGAVFASAVILPEDFKNQDLNDSKQLSEKKRYKLRPVIEREAIAWAVGIVSPEEIDKINILKASFLAMHRAIEQLKVQPEHLLIDGNRFTPYPDIPHTTVVKGDGKYLSIAAASILAKTYRDTYNGDMFPHMKTFLSHLLERNYQSRTVAFLENGSWAPTAAKVMRKTLETAKNLTFTETTVTIKSAVSDASRAQIEALAAELAGEAPRS